MVDGQPAGFSAASRRERRRLKPQLSLLRPIISVIGTSFARRSTELVQLPWLAGWRRNSGSPLRPAGYVPGTSDWGITGRSRQPQRAGATRRRGSVAGERRGVRKIATTACYPAGMIGLVFFLAVMLVLPAGATVRLLRESRRNAGALWVSAHGRCKSPLGPLTARNILLTEGPQYPDQPIEFPRAYRRAGPGPARPRPSTPPSGQMSAARRRRENTLTKARHSLSTAGDSLSDARQNSLSKSA